MFDYIKTNNIRLQKIVYHSSFLVSNLVMQGAVSGQQVSHSDSEEDLNCMNCRWMEMGHMSSFTGRCDWCGGVPPRLQWMYPGSSTRGQLRTVRARRRRPQREDQSRSSSAERAAGRTGSSSVPVVRRQQRCSTNIMYRILH